jgi:hypothetical protein
MPVCGVATVVFVALNRCAVIIADILKLVCLVPIPIYPCDIIFAQVKYFDRCSFGILCLFIVNRATIQCYKYDSGDTTHWPYFDYISANETIAEFIPNSDFRFLEMRKHMEFQGTFLDCVQE